MESYCMVWLLIHDTSILLEGSAIATEFNITEGDVLLDLDFHKFVVFVNSVKAHTVELESLFVVSEFKLNIAHIHPESACMGTVLVLEDDRV